VCLVPHLNNDNYDMTIEATCYQMPFSFCDAHEQQQNKRAHITSLQEQELVSTGYGLALHIHAPHAWLSALPTNYIQCVTFSSREGFASCLSAYDVGRYMVGVQRTRQNTIFNEFILCSQYTSISLFFGPRSGLQCSLQTCSVSCRYAVC
jgi:hypothetical protein